MPRNTAIVIVLLVAVISIWIVASTRSGGNTGIGTPQSTVQATPTLPPIGQIPTAPPIQVGTFRGTVTAVNSQSLSVRTDKGSKTFSIVQAKDVKRITSGSIDAGDAKIEQVSVSALAVGQEVIVIAKDSSTAASIFILK